MFKTTTIEVRILCTPRLDSLGNTVGSPRCLQHRWLSKKMMAPNERGRASTSFIVLRHEAGKMVLSTLASNLI
jgi:hypothetical protein